MSQDNEKKNVSADSQSQNDASGGVPFDEAQAIDAEPHSEEECRSVTTWKPEDAANFLAKAIRESQKPLAEALARPSVPVHVVWMVVLALIIFGGGIYYNLYRAEKRLEVKEAEDESTAKSLLAERSDAAVREARLSGKVELLQKELIEANTKIAGYKKSEEDYRSMERELNRARGEQDALKKSIAELNKKLEAASKTEKELASAKDEIGRLRSASSFVQEQMDAQAAEVTALRKQLQSSRKVVRALQGDTDTTTVNDTETEEANKALLDKLAPEKTSEEENVKATAEPDDGDDKAEDTAGKKAESEESEDKE